MPPPSSTLNADKAKSTAPKSRPGRHEPRDPRSTPAMKQYRRFKEQHPECVLFFRMGDFYEMFDDDAVLTHKVLGITLTERTAGVPMSGVPYHSVETYLQKMIQQGYRVAVCEQTQDPKEAKGVVERAVTRVLTPGTLIDESLLDEAQANQVGAIAFTEAGEHSNAVLAVAELSTGSFTLHNLAAGSIQDELARLGVSELLHIETADSQVPLRVATIRETLGCALTARPTWTFRQTDAADMVREQFGVATLSGFGLDDDDPALAPAGALLRYIQETQASEDSAEQLAHLRPPRRVAADEHLIIDATSLRSLEIEQTMRSGAAEGSLLSVLQHAKSPMGKRLLRNWLCFPLRDLERIKARQRAVAAMLEDQTFANELARQIGQVQDVARIASRLAMGRATPRDLVGLGGSVAKMQAVIDLLDQRPAFDSSLKKLTTLSENLLPLAETIVEQCVDHPPAHMREGGLFRDGVDEALDEARALQANANSWLAAYQKRLIEESTIPSLKVGYNKVFGYYIEVTHAHSGKVPDEFNRKQTLKNAERYITPELKEFEEKVTTAETRAIEREKDLFDRLCKHAAGHATQLIEFAELIAALDVLGSFSETAKRFGYVKPDLVDEPVLDIAQGRHPVLDRTLRDRFVPNDCSLGCPGDHSEGSDDPGDQSSASLAVITGPNMAGKSTYIRQVALIVLLAHTGSYVPADKATIGLTDRIFTRIGASDELHAGQSTFMVEMTEAANILHHATEHSLVILDEIGRGTSTLDGLSLAWAIAESLAEVHCRTLFATHYHELTSLGDGIENVANLHVAVREWGEEIVFLHRILPGRTDRSYGIHVAKLAGLPTAAVTRATRLLETLAVQTEKTELAEISPQRSEPGGQMGLFTEYLTHPVIDELKAIDLNTLSPMQAFEQLQQFIDKVKTTDHR